MDNTKATVLQELLDQLCARSQVIDQGIQQRTDQIQRFNIEIEQHRGAHAYNQMLIEETRKKLAELAANTAAT